MKVPATAEMLERTQVSRNRGKRVQEIRQLSPHIVMNHRVNEHKRHSLPAATAEKNSASAAAVMSPTKAEITRKSFPAKIY